MSNIKSPALSRKAAVLLNEREQRLFLSILFYAALGAAAWFALRYLLGWLFPFLVGGGLSALLRPAILRCAKGWHLDIKWAAVLVITGFYVLVVGSLLLLLILIALQAYEMLLEFPLWYTHRLEPLLEGFSQKLTVITDGSGLGLAATYAASTLREGLLGAAALVLGCLGTLAAKIPHFVVTFLFTVIITYLTGTGYHVITRFLCDVLPHKGIGLLRRSRLFLRDVLGQYLRAYTMILAVTFIELALGLWLLGIPYALPIAALIAIVDVLPVLGCGTVLIPWSVLTLAAGNIPLGVGILLLYALIFLVRMVLEPKVIGAQIGLHPVATMTAMYAGLQIAGLAGMLAAPLLVLGVLKLSSTPKSAANAPILEK